ncbi:N-acetylmuramoyl-L-alanine amidase [Neochlamydia sp. AcF95]|uniref:N-acetylmuramoyl-L-alanine amidase family protein n=1 Tax=Neochlamydia sp. AcF95 TaxID=2795734 RepID=UPI001BD8F16F|nr:N-acetylmuramoyl-L-alanine amidase [Neochlamydia sp. AcF95]MBS4169710.1 Uncharacterized protein YqiI [Neochlamydia sp. AcF95]
MIKNFRNCLWIFLLLSLGGCRCPSKELSSQPAVHSAPVAQFPFENKMGINPPLKNIKRSRLSKAAMIVIDAGHGGDDFGTRSLSQPKYHEKFLNLTTSLALNEFLQKMGYQTRLTRSNDEFISLQKRANFANDQDADLFVSVHYNSAPAKQADGIEIFYYKSDINKKRSTQSSQLASSILTQVIQATKAKSRGVKEGNFAVIRETKMPAVLIEGGFLTNEKEMNKIKEPAYIKKIAWGIAKGVEAYLNERAVSLP